MTGSEKTAQSAFTVGPRAQAAIGGLMVLCGAFLGLSGLSPVDGAMMLVAGAFFAGIGGYRLLEVPS
jgi:hypothetical protein